MLAIMQVTARLQQSAEDSLLLSQYQASTDADEVDLDLIDELLCFVCGEGRHARKKDGEASLGAILVFLPGLFRPPLKSGFA